MRTIEFHQEAFEEYSEWARTDKKVFQRIRRLIVETSRAPFTGIGKPEPLKSGLKGHWSRRISHDHRLVYIVSDATLTIVSCRNHYGE